MPSTTIPRGNILLATLIGPTLTPVAVAGSTSAEQSFTIPGLQVGDFVDVNSPITQTAGISIGNVRVSATNTLAILFANSTGGSLTPASGQYTINICRPENSVLPTNNT